MPHSLRTAIIVNPELPVGLLTNTAGAIAIGLGAKVPELAARQLTDGANRTIDVSSRLPVPILQASNEVLQSLTLRALVRDEDKVVVPFPSFARSLHDYADYEACFPERDLSEELIDGLGIAGPAKWVKALTGSLKLLR